MTTLSLRALSLPSGEYPICNACTARVPNSACLLNRGPIKQKATEGEREMRGTRRGRGYGSDGSDEEWERRLRRSRSREVSNEYHLPAIPLLQPAFSGVFRCVRPAIAMGTVRMRTATVTEIARGVGPLSAARAGTITAIAAPRAAPAPRCTASSNPACVLRHATRDTGRGTRRKSLASMQTAQSTWCTMTAKQPLAFIAAQCGSLKMVRIGWLDQSVVTMISLL